MAAIFHISKPRVYIFSVQFCYFFVIVSSNIQRFLPFVKHNGSKLHLFQYI